MGFGSGADRTQGAQGPNAAASPGTPTATCPADSEYHLHVDADRDGVVDDNRLGIDRWTWGASGRGAIILCNNDDEDRTHNPDNEDAKINGAPDPEDIAPLVIRRVAGCAPAPASWRAFLEVSADDATRIRIFASRAPGAAQVLGAGVGDPPSAAVRSYALPDLNFTEKEFGVEAVMYPQGAFTGLIMVTLRIERGTGAPHTEQAALRVAPWVCFTHLDKTTRVYVGETVDNVLFRGTLISAVTGFGVPSPEVVPPPHGTDRWLQDAMEIGFSSLPRPGPPAGRHLPVVLRTANDRLQTHGGKIDLYPREKMLEPGFGWVQALPPLNGSSLDSFGNLECSPPFTHRRHRKEYKFGRLIYGRDPRGTTLRDNMQPRVIDFLEKQQIQAPFAIDTGWLEVGHVDEVMSFVPMKNAPKKYKVILASPATAVTICRDLRTRGQGGARLLQGIDIPAASGLTAAHITAQYPHGTVDQVLGNAAFMRVQTDIEARIMGIKQVMKTELDLADSDFVSLPVLFMILDSGKYVAYTPGVVNSLVLTKADKTVRLCMPKPFGPVVGGVCQFERFINISLGPAGTTGVDINFIDDFCTYHMLMGEIHCGTNSKREPPVDRWWWEQQV